MATPATVTPIVWRIFAADIDPFFEGIAKRSFNCTTTYNKSQYNFFNPLTRICIALAYIAFNDGKSCSYIVTYSADI